MGCKGWSNTVTAVEPTGIKVLDDLLGGGLPRPSAVGIIGAVGSGKSSLVRQLAVTMLERDFRVLYYAIDESAEAYPVEEPEQIVDSTFKFSDLVAQGRSFTLKHLGKKQFVIMDSLTPFFLMVEAKRVFQFGQVLKYATRFAKAIGVATLHTKVLDESIENAMVNFADVVLELERRKTPEGISRGGTLRLVKLGKTQIPSRGYYYEMTPQGIVISTAPPI